MVFLSPGQNTFTGGEVSEKVLGRLDLALYSNSLKRLENMISFPHGGITRRCGTRFVAEVKDSTKEVRLVPFVFSKTDAFAIEFGDGYVRFFKDRAQLVAPAAVASVTNGDFAADISGWSDTSVGTGQVQWNASNAAMQFDSTSGNEAAAEQSITTTDTSELHILRFQVKEGRLGVSVGSSSGDDDILEESGYNEGWHTIEFTPGISPFFVSFGAEAIDDGSLLDNVAFLDDEPIEITSPYASANLETFDYSQAADFMFIADEAIIPHELIRRNTHSWSLAVVKFQDGPYDPVNADTSKKITQSGVAADATGTGTFTAVGSGFAPFKSTDVGRLFKLKNGFAEITGFTDERNVTVNILQATGVGSGKRNDWAFGSWNVANEDVPSTVDFYEQRSVWAATKTRPQTFWLSQTDQIRGFLESDPIEDSDAAIFTIAGRQANKINWVMGADVLLMGSLAGTWRAHGDTRSQAITPSSISVRPNNDSRRASRAVPLSIDGEVIYKTNDERKLISLKYDFQSDSHASSDLNLLAEHITLSADGGIKYTAFAREPDSVVWTIRRDGVVPALTYFPSEQVLGWHRHIIGGTFNGGNAVAESVASIPGTAFDEVWFCVKRTIDGNTKRYIEFMESEFRPENGKTIEDAYFVDCGLSYDGSPATVFAGLDHLEGEEVHILADGAVVPPETVSSGQITLDNAASKVHIGLPYTSEMETLPLEVLAEQGNTFNRKKRIVDATVHFLNTNAAKYGRDESNLDTLPFRKGTDKMDTPVPLFSGKRRVSFPGNYALEAKVIVQQELPLPLTVLAVVTTMDVES